MSVDAQEAAYLPTGGGGYIRKKFVDMSRHELMFVAMTRSPSRLKTQAGRDRFQYLAKTFLFDPQDTTVS